MNSSELDKTLLLHFGESVRSRRKQLSLSQEELAERCQLDRTYVGSVERGERNVSLKNISKLAKALGISIQDLFNGNE